MKRLSRTSAVVGAVFLLAVFVRVALGVATQSWRFSPEEKHWEFGYEMGRVAGSLAAGQGFSYPTDPPQPTAWMAPAYPLFVAGVFSVFGPFTPKSAIAIELLQVVASAISCVLLYALAARLYGSAVGFVSAFLLAFYPPSAHYAVQKIWSSTFFTAALLLALLLFSQQARRPSQAGMALLGLTLGVGALLDPLLLSIIPPMTAWLCWIWRRRRQRWGAFVVLLLCTCGLVLVPWTVRNYVTFGRIVLVKSNFGHELLVGNHERAMLASLDEMTGIERELRGFTEPIRGLSMTESELASLRGLNEVEMNHVYFQRGLQSVLGDPLRFLRFTVIRIVRYWTMVRTPDHVRELIYQVPYFFVFLLGLPGIFLAIRRRLPTAVLAVPLTFFPLAYYVTVVGLHRYRFPMEPLLLIFSAITVVALASRLGLKSDLSCAAP